MIIKYPTTITMANGKSWMKWKKKKKKIGCIQFEKIKRFYFENYEKSPGDI